MPAYCITTPDEDTSYIVFADSPGRAKQSCDAMAHYEFIEIRAKRLPQFDHFEGLGHVPLSAALAAGWYTRCRGCEMPIHDGDEFKLIDDETWEAHCATCASEGPKWA